MDSYTQSPFGSDPRDSALFELKRATAANFYPCIDAAHPDEFKRGVFCGMRRIFDMLNSPEMTDNDVFKLSELELILNTQHYQENKEVFFDGLRNGNAQARVIIKDIMGEVV